MGNSSLSQLLSLRRTRAERAENILVAAVSEKNIAIALVEERHRDSERYAAERPSIEQEYFSNFQSSACDLTATDRFRHEMRSCETEAMRLQQLISEAELRKNKSLDAEKTAREQYHSSLRKCEKLHLLLKEYSEADALTAQRVEDNELDEWSVLTKTSATM